jgi:hypothetical protein
MTTYRADLARGWLFENWLWFAKTFGMALKRQLPVEFTICSTREQNDSDPRRISLVARTELPPDGELAELYLRTERVPECLEKYQESQLLRQWKAWTAVARVAEALDRTLKNGDTEFLDRLSAWLDTQPEPARPADQGQAAS